MSAPTHGTYLIIEYVGDNDDYPLNYALFYENTTKHVDAKWLNFGGNNPIATRKSVEISGKTCLEITGHDGRGVIIHSDE